MSNQTMNRELPLIIGITGYRALRKEEYPVFKETLKRRLTILHLQFPSLPFVMMNALASGADRLAAEVAEEAEIPLLAVLPFEREEYEKDFEGDDLAAFRRQMAYAEHVVTVSSLSEGRDAGYRAAGTFIADHTAILIAFWDGKEGTDTGCGTNDIVRYTLRERGHQTAVIQVLASRESDPETAPKTGTESFPNVDRLLSLSDEVERLNELNRKEESESLYDAADRLSVTYQKKYLGGIRLMAIIGVLLVVAFLFYDELTLGVMILVYAILLAVGAAVASGLKKRKLLEKHIQYRLFAETLRVQGVLDKAQIDCNATSFFSWTMKDDVQWIETAVETMKLFPEESIGPLDDLKEEWLLQQKTYHENAAEKTRKKMKRNDIISTVVLLLTVLIIVGGSVVQVLAFSADFMAEIIGTLRFWIIFGTGLLSAVTVFLSAYYGKLSLDRQYQDHLRMALLYGEGLREAEEKGMTPELVTRIAREEVLENGIWCSYTKENKISLIM